MTNQTKTPLEPLPCPFCKTVLSSYTTHRSQERFWKHPLSGCVLSRFTVAPEGIAAWNQRTRPDTSAPVSVDAMLDAMVEAWSDADAHHSVRDTCRDLLNAALASTPTVSGDAVELVAKAIIEEQALQVGRSKQDAELLANEGSELDGAKAVARAAIAALASAGEGGGE